MALPAPPRPHDVRLRRVLALDTQPPVWPATFSLKPFTARDAAAVHALLVESFADENPDFAAWWQARSGDPEYDAGLVFPVEAGTGDLLAVAWCWSSGFVKDLAVASAARRRGLAEALMRHVFQTFRERGVGHVDLKTNTLDNAEAYRLYRRLGMVEVGWGG